MARHGPTLLAATAIVPDNDISDHEYHFLTSRFKQSIPVLSLPKPDEIVYEMAEQFPKANFTLKNICVQNIFAFSGTNVAAAEWDLALTNREGKDFQVHGVTVVNIKKGKIVLMSIYQLDTEIMRGAWGEDDLLFKN